jgi:DNA-binding IclR family transcriptional regulator
MTGGTSFERGLGVLAVLVDRGPLRAEALAGTLGMPLSTAYRYLKALRAAGFVEEHDGHYRATVAPAADPDGELVRLARPHLERLVAVTGETALLVTRAHQHAVYLDAVAPVDRTHTEFPIGQPLPIHSGASKRVLLAFAPEPVRRRVLAAPLQRFTPTSPGRADLARLLDATRRSGTAVSHGEFIPGTHAVAAPLLRAGHLVGSLAVSGIAGRCEGDWSRRAREAVRRAAAEVESRW